MKGHDLTPGAVETHISVLVFMGDEVWKFRKPVKFSFLDFSTASARRWACEREVELNRRFAPAAYLGVGETLDASGRPEAFTIMRRMPEDLRLSTLVAGGDDRVPGALEDLAGLLAAAHASGARGPEIDRAATGTAMRAVWDQSTAELERFCPEVLDPGVLERVTSRYRDFLDGREELFAARIAAGAVCDGHGDLQAEDVFCTDDGPVVLDCIEFDDRLRSADVLADVGFLAMDLQRLEAPGAAAHFVAAYEAASSLPSHAPLLSFHVAARAHVRAKVACLRTEQLGEGPDRTAAIGRARLLLDLCDEHLARCEPRLVLVGGSPGTGKSTLARELSALTGWDVLRSDVVRKELAGLDPTQRGGTEPDAGLYGPVQTGRVYERMLADAAGFLRNGMPVILDASWTSEDHRRAAREVASRCRAAVVELRCECPDDVARQRVRRRLEEGSDASDATEEVADLLAGRADAWPGAVTVDTSVPAGDAASGALVALGPVAGVNPTAAGRGQ